MQQFAKSGFFVLLAWDDTHKLNQDRDGPSCE